jgi:small nuclear ribonucleoprotein G
MDKRLLLQLNGNRKVSGVLRGYDAFMNIVLDETIEENSSSGKLSIGMVVSPTYNASEYISFFLVGYSW